VTLFFNLIYPNQLIEISIIIIGLFLFLFFHSSLMRSLGLTRARLSFFFIIFFSFYSLFFFCPFFFFGCGTGTNYCLIGLFPFFSLFLLLHFIPPLSPRLGWASRCCLALLDLDHVGLWFSVCIFFFFIRLYFGLDWPTLFCYVNRFA